MAIARRIVLDLFAWIAAVVTLGGVLSHAVNSSQAGVCGNSRGNALLQVKKRMTIDSQTARMQSFPGDIMTCPQGAVSTTLCMTTDTYDSIMFQIGSILTNMDSTCNASTCPQADWAGCVLRMAGHDFMDFQWGAGGGSDGCIDFNDIDNAGLEPCLTSATFVHAGNFNSATILSVYQQVCTAVSLADFFVLAAEGVMKHTRENSGATDVKFRSSFRYGRTTATECNFAQGRLPNPENGCSASEMVFINHLDMTWRETAALMGVHSLGRTHIQNSGYHGWWSDPDNSRRFNNNYYVSLLSKAWGPRNVTLNKNQWDRVDIGAPGFNSEGNEMMLNTDLCLAFADVMAGDAVSEVACPCMWVLPDNFFGVIDAMPSHSREWCAVSDLIQPGTTNVSQAEIEPFCCPQQAGSCDDLSFPNGVAAEAVQQFAEDDALWFAEFMAAWTKATTKGWAHQENILFPLQSSCTAEDLSRDVVAIMFPSTTTTTTTTTTAYVVSQETASRWYIGGHQEDCHLVCQRQGKQCTVDAWNTYGHEIDSVEEFSALISVLERRWTDIGTFGRYTVGDFSTPGGGGTVSWALARYPLNAAEETGRLWSRTQIPDPPPATEEEWCELSKSALWARRRRDTGVHGCHTYQASTGFISPTIHPHGACQYAQPNRSWPISQCNGVYNAGWRRICVCEASAYIPAWVNASHSNENTPPAAVPFPDISHLGVVTPFTTSEPVSATAYVYDTSNYTGPCLKRFNGMDYPDPDCCANAPSGRCAAGYEFKLGLPCMYNHHDSYHTTICELLTVTTTTTTVIPAAQGWFLSPKGDQNCSAVCERQNLVCNRYAFKDQGWSQVGTIGGVTEIINAIKVRDWLGLTDYMLAGRREDLHFNEEFYGCDVNGRDDDGDGQVDLQLAEGHWGHTYDAPGIKHGSCFPVHSRWQHTHLPADYCVGAEAPRRQNYRRLCKCIEPELLAEHCESSDTGDLETLKFVAPDANPKGWSYTDSDPTEVNCNTWNWGPAENWNRNDWRNGWNLEGRLGLTINNTTFLDWRAEPGSKAAVNEAAERDIILHFCQPVTLQQAIIIPYHHDHPVVAYQLQYQDAIGTWRDSGVNGVAAMGYGLRSNANDQSQYWTYGPATCSSSNWRIRGVMDTADKSALGGNKHCTWCDKKAGGLQVTVKTSNPHGYTLVGSGAMCTDNDLTPYGNIEIGNHPDDPSRWTRSTQPDVNSCASRCDSISGCVAFLYWPPSTPAEVARGGHCRTYRACEKFVCHGCHEYMYSLAYRASNSTSR